MPVLVETDDVIKGYFKQCLEQNLYPGIPLDKFESICKSSFYFVKDQIESGEMPLIHMKYFGKFSVVTGAVKKLMIQAMKDVRLNYLTPEEYEQRMEYLNKVLANIELEKIDQEIELIDDV